MKDVVKQRESLEAIFNSMSKSDLATVTMLAKSKYNTDEERSAFIEGYLHSIENPHSKSIRLISMYAYDYVPYYISLPKPNTVVSNIQYIFRNVRSKNRC